MEQVWVAARRRRVTYALLCICMVGIVLGANLYKNLRYSTFALSVHGPYALSQASNGFGSSNQRIEPTQQASTPTVYQHLRTYWWGNHTVYTLGSPASGLWFRVESTVRGDFVLVPGDDGSQAAVMGIDVRDQAGHSVHDLRPGQWYEVKQYGQPLQIKLNW
ncbi:hypothetical protein SAMN05421799_11271 [Alicyclobacillus vulcanalis]|uniref:Uncharacterized protein n=1 Tax=Alicyclobacillus vulcanalis TaxID=252246 RepID=A0A1N7PB15_9BACL|nr:hypothetical protein SAMN05421799_11271 [Alicyclobacillus vulcanalis]